MTGIKLETGKTYLDRKGEKHGPLVHVPEGFDTIFEYTLGNGDFTWRKDGRVYNNSENIRDLIEEVVEVETAMRNSPNYKHEVRRPADYNDGTIHGWNGGDCPVHPETVVEYWLRDGVPDTIKAEGLWWSHETTGSDVIAFRVVKEYVEPKVIWVNEYAASYFAHENDEEARKHATEFATRIAVKYVECKE